MKVNKVLFAITTITLITISAIPVSATKIITVSADKMPPDLYEKTLEYDPSLGGYRPLGLPYTSPTNLQLVNKTTTLQEVILTPLRVEKGPQFVRPQELFKIKAVLKNKDDVAYTIAIIRKPTPSLWERVTGSFEWFKNAIMSIFGQVPKEPKTVNETWEIIPIYYMIAALDPKGIQVYSPSNTKAKIIYPGGAHETEPGYGCYDIVLGNAMQMVQVAEKLKKGELSADDLMCGKISSTPQAIEAPFAGSVNVASKFGPLTVALPVQVYSQEGATGKAVVQVKGNEVVGIVTGCTDRGDGRPYEKTFTLNGKTYRVYIPSKPHDCILTPGESMEFEVYGIVNPIPSGMLPPEAAGEVIPTLYSQPERAEELMSKYPGAIHELYLFVGRINDVSIGITTDDIVKTIGSIVAPAAGGAFLGIPGVAMGLFINYLAIGKWFDLTLFQKAWNCVYTGKCIYEVSSLHKIKTYLVIVAPKFQASLYLVHLGMIVFMVAAGGYLGLRLGGT